MYGVHYTVNKVFWRAALVALVGHLGCAIVGCTVISRVGLIVPQAVYGCQRIIVPQMTRMIMDMLLAGVIMGFVVMVGVLVWNTIGVEFVNVVVRGIRIDGVIGGHQRRCAFVCVGVVGAGVAPTTSFVFILSSVAAVVGGVSNNVCLAVYFVDMTSKYIENTVGLLQV